MIEVRTKHHAVLVEHLWIFRIKSSLRLELHCVLTVNLGIPMHQPGVARNLNLSGNKLAIDFVPALWVTFGGICSAQMGTVAWSP